MATNSSEFIQAPFVNAAELNALPISEAPISTIKVSMQENAVHCQTPIMAKQDITPRSSKSPDYPCNWYPRRLDFDEGSSQFQAMARGIDRLCGLLQTSGAQNSLQVVPKTLILCEKATSPHVPKLAISKVEQYSISAAPEVPQPNKLSQSTQTNFVILSKSQVVIESFPPRHNVDSSDDSSDNPSTTLSTNSPIMGRINNDFDMSSESDPEPDQSNRQPLDYIEMDINEEDTDESFGHANEDFEMEQV
jgi:hypothetical protein